MEERAVRPSVAQAHHPGSVALHAAVHREREKWEMITNLI